MFQNIFFFKRKKNITFVYRPKKHVLKKTELMKEKERNKTQTTPNDTLKKQKISSIKVKPSRRKKQTGRMLRFFTVERRTRGFASSHSHGLIRSIVRGNVTDVRKDLREKMPGYSQSFFFVF